MQKVKKRFGDKKKFLQRSIPFMKVYRKNFKDLAKSTFEIEKNSDKRSKSALKVKKKPSRSKKLHQMLKQKILKVKKFFCGQKK